MKAYREKWNFSNGGKTIRVTVNLSSNTMEAKKYTQPKILYPVNLPIRNEEKLNTFTDEGKLRICQQLTYPQIMAKKMFCENKGNDKRRKLRASVKKKK